MAVEPLPALLEALERRLLAPAVRNSVGEVSALLADEFVEFGSSGAVYTKAEMVAALQMEQSPRADARDFAVRILAPDIALITYRTERRNDGAPPKQSRRSSIWRHLDDRWQMIFHQGTPIPIGD